MPHEGHRGLRPTKISYSWSYENGEGLLLFRSVLKFQKGDNYPGWLHFKALYEPEAITNCITYFLHLRRNCLSIPPGLLISEKWVFRFSILWSYSRKDKTTFPNG